MRVDCSRLFRATPQREPGKRSLRSEANQQRWQGILQTAHRAPGSYDHRSSVRSANHQGSMCASSGPSTGGLKQGTRRIAWRASAAASMLGASAERESGVAASNPDDDPGWDLSPRTLLILVPGFAHPALRGRRSGRSRDGLTMIREVWLSFSVATILFGMVALLAAEPPTQPAGPWVTALAVATVLCLTAAEVFGRRPLDCSDLAALATSYRSRFFLRTAFSQAIALFAFAATLIVGRWWIYWLFLPFTLYGFGRNAPTTGHLSAEQERLGLAGCNLSLVRAIRGITN
jgi:hypothetical protein